MRHQVVAPDSSASDPRCTVPGSVPSTRTLLPIWALSQAEILVLACLPGALRKGLGPGG